MLHKVPIFDFPRIRSERPAEIDRQARSWLRLHLLRHWPVEFVGNVGKRETWSLSSAAEAS